MLVRESNLQNFTYVTGLCQKAFVARIWRNFRARIERITNTLVNCMTW